MAEQRTEADAENEEPHQSDNVNGSIVLKSPYSSSSNAVSTTAYLDTRHVPVTPAESVSHQLVLKVRDPLFPPSITGSAKDTGPIEAEQSIGLSRALTSFTRLAPSE